MSNLIGGRSVRHQKRALSCGVSAVALLLSGQAAAQCAPNPAQGNAVTTCTGTEAGGLGVTGNATVNLTAGATIQAPNAGASAIRVSSAIAGANAVSNLPILNLDGGVTGGGAGIGVDSGVTVPPNFSPPTINPRINIGATGTVTGVSGINLIGNLANPAFSATQANIVNRGTIAGTGGFALLATNPERAYFTSVENLAGGQIGAINAYVGQLTNAGTIDGGANSAYRYATNLPYGGGGTITNSGTIASASAIATIAPGTSSSNLSPIGINNTGRIVNTGTGKAIITAGAINLVNRGTITGMIDASAPDPYFLPPFSNGHRIDNSGGGIIDGSVILGPGRDTLIVDFGTAANPIAGITGAVDGGAGEDILQLRLTGNTTLSSALAGAANFETVAFSMPSTATLTLANGFTAPNGVRFIDAPGTVVNEATLVTSRAAIAPAGAGQDGPAIINRGSITATIPASPEAFNDVAVRPGTYRSLTNSGSITAIGGRGVDLSMGDLDNTGSIVASGIAATLFNGRLTNSNLIESTSGVGLRYSGNVGVRGTNSGTIRGAVAAVRTSVILENSGLITSPNIGVQLDPYGAIVNNAGAVITGGAKAIAPAQAGVFNGSVDNAGTINGSVDFGTSGFASNNRYVARAGSSLNGNLHLGSGGDTLIAELGGSGSLGGVTGTITGDGFETLQYLVTASTTTQVGAQPAVFDAIFYDLKDTTLNLSTPGSVALGMGFLGKGTVNFSGTISGTTATDNLIGVDIGNRTSFHVGADGLPLRGITFVNFGTIARTRTTAITAQSAAISGGDIVNAGTVTVLNTAAEPFSGIGLMGINSGGSVTNSGTINVGGAVGVAGQGGKLSFVNSGAILQIAGQPNGRGVVGAEKVINTGTISTGGDAVTIGAFFTNFAGSVTNSGTIASSAGYGVRGENTGWTATLTNEAGGTISGAVAGVALGLGGTVTNSGGISSAGTGVLLGQNTKLENRAGGTVSGTTLAVGRDPSLAASTPTSATIRNAGTINGNVNLAGSATVPTRNTFVALAGGAVNGNLNLGTGGDTLVVEYGAPGPLAGVTGSITGSGDAALRYLINADAAVSLTTPSIFNTVGFDLANNAIVTATASGPKTMNVEFAGVGTVDLTADLTGNAARPTLNLAATSIQPTGNPPAVPRTKLSVTSRGALSATADANTPLVTQFPTATVASAVATIAGNTFTNEGTITARNLAFANRRMAAIGGGGTVINNGTILLDGATGIDGGTLAGGNLAVTNTGTIQQQGALSRGVAGVLTLTNSGTIRTGGTAVTPAGSGIASGLRQIINSGTVASTGGLAVESLDTGSFTAIINAAGGVITGNGTAIRLANGRIDNSDTINGSLNLGGNFSGSSLVNRGAVNGDVRFGAGSDTLTVYEGSTITGAVDGGAGFDTYIRGLSASAELDLGPAATGALNFERFGFSALSADTILTVHNAAGVKTGGVVFNGLGKIVSDVQFATSTSTPFGPGRANTVVLGTTANYADSQLVFVNNGVLGDGLLGGARSVENNGTIGAAALNGSVVNLAANGNGDFLFRNTGSILTTVADTTFDAYPSAVAIFRDFDLPALQRAEIRNESVIDGGLRANLYARDIVFANSGTITGRTLTFGPDDTFKTSAVDLSATDGFFNQKDLNTRTLALGNSGRLAGSTQINGAIDIATFANTGQTESIGIGIFRIDTGDLAQGLDGAVDTARIGFDNSDAVAGIVSINGQTTRIDFANSGSIAAPSTPGLDWAVNILNDTVGSGSVVFDNTGTIASLTPGSSGVVIGGQAISAETRRTFSFDPLAPAVAGKPGATIAFTNSGTISANGGAEYSPPFVDPWETGPASLSRVTGVGMAPFGEGETSIALTNTATGVISANGATWTASGTVPAELRSVGSVAVSTIADRVTIVNEGKIVGTAGGTVPSNVQVDLVDTTVAVAATGYLAGAIQTFGSVDTLTNRASGTITGSIDLGDFDDTVINYGRIDGDLFLRAGNDTLLHSLSGSITGIADGGDGIDRLTINLTGGGTLDVTRFINFEDFSFTGSGALGADGPLTLDTVSLAGGDLRIVAGQTLATAGSNTVTGTAASESLTNAGTIAGNVDLGDGANQVTNAAGGTIVGSLTTGAGNDAFINGGRVNGAVNLGNGNNTLTILTGALFGGSVTAGTGSDTLIFQTGGTYQAPTLINPAAFVGFETLQNAGGTSRLTGSFAGGVNVTGGYLFGVQGLTITGNVDVGNGAQFGTSGVVNGNVAIGAGGTLAPGSSPGIMTVNGNVSLAAGAISTFEFVPSPGQSDQLLISGTLAIGASTTLNMTGNRPLTPGANYDLIVANGGITGTFATVNQPATIGGFLRYTANRLQLMGTFVTPIGVTLQQASAIDYVNATLISGQASNALLTAVPSLLQADGAASPAAFNLLTAEAYASASQLGVENALTLAQASRSGIVRTDRDNAGLFVFAQGMGDRRTLNAGAATGASRARSDSWGVLGGIGYGVDGASVGAFIGRLDSRQRIAAIGASTDGDGVIAGIAGHFAVEGFEFNLLGAYDWTKAVTGRSVPGARVDSSEYRLGSLVLDASVGANIPLGTDWAVRPEVGVIHVRGHRGAARETGSGAFAFDVDSDGFSASFIDTSIALKGGLGEGSAFHPWVQAGIRRQIAGGAETASAGFVGGTSRFTSFGAGRKETVVTAGAGLSYDMGRATLFAAYQGEFGGGNGHNGNVGVRFGF